MIDWPIPGNDSWDNYKKNNNYKKEKKLHKDLEKSAFGRWDIADFFAHLWGVDGEDAT